MSFKYQEIGSTGGVFAPPSAITTAFANLTTAGDATLVGAVANKRVVVFGYRVHSDSALVVTFKSSVAGAIGPGMPTPPGGFGAGLRELSYFATVAGEALVANISANGTVGIEVDYILVDRSVG